MSEGERLDRISSLMRTDDSVDAPADSVRWVKNLYRMRAVEHRPSLVRQLVATLQSELLPGVAAFGERSAGVGQARQLFFSAGEMAVGLTVTGGKKGLNVRGQVLGQSFSGAKVVLANDSFTFETSVGDTDEFQIKNVSSGRYSLTIRGQNKEIVIEEMEL